MGQNSSKTLQGANKLNIDASDSYITEIGVGLRKGTIPISEIIKMEKYNKLKQKIHVQPKKKRSHKVVNHEEVKSNVKDTNYRKETRQNNIPAKHGDAVIRNYPRMRSGGGQNNNNPEHARKLQKDLLKLPSNKDELREVFKNYEYSEKSNHKKNQNKTLQRKYSYENHAMKMVMNKNTDKKEELFKDKEDYKIQKPKRFVMETNVSCIVPPKHIYYDEQRKVQNREISCENSRCPCKKHECPYLKKQHRQFASITAMSQDDIRFRRQQENQFNRYNTYHGTEKFVNKMDPRARQQRNASIVSISQDNLRGRNCCRENQCRRIDRSVHRLHGNDEERTTGRHQETRYDVTYPTKRKKENKVTSPKEALEHWKKIHTLRQQRHQQTKLKEPSDEMLDSNYESRLKYGRHDAMNNSPTVQKIWPPNRNCCIRRTSSVMSTMLEHAADYRYRDGIHADLERCLLQHAKRSSDCRENECRYNKSTWVQDRHRKWHKVILND
ncbi:hypothetical protein CBL_08339 [Carabus blaptoides fortunei]